MPWLETNPMQQRWLFIQDYRTGLWSMSELCARYGISRKTGYAVLQRYQAEGRAGLRPRSRAPHHCPHHTPRHVEEAILAAKKRHPRWGARKLRRDVAKRRPELLLPARSTIGDLLARRGLVKRKRRRKAWRHPGVAPLKTHRPNEIWTIDFKGQFRTRDGAYCYPLTVADHFSRYILCCRALPSIRTEYVRPVLHRLFQAVGLPDAIRSDNGPPFASTGVHGLCALNVWWLQLGIVHQRILPANPQQNGTHERMHKDLKADTTRPPASSRRGQQRLFDRFVGEYNTERPHEALDDDTPAEHWVPSARSYPQRIAPPEYPAHYAIRRVSTGGTFRMAAGLWFLSNALQGEYIGLEEIDDGIWSIYYYQNLLARIDERKGVFSA